MTGPIELDHQPQPRSRLRALGRGLRRRCPRCGHCGLALDGHYADDAPPTFTILIVGHVVVGAMLSVETLRHPPSWVHAALLPPIKGALVGLQWAPRRHGFEIGEADA